MTTDPPQASTPRETPIEGTVRVQHGAAPPAALAHEHAHRPEHPPQALVGSASGVARNREHT